MRSWPNKLPFPFNIRAAMRVWDWLYFTEGDFKPDPQQSRGMEPRRLSGAGPGHCGACHTPKNFLGGDKTSEYLQGSQLQGWFAPDITNDNARGSAAGRWTTSWPI